MTDEFRNDSLNAPETAPADVVMIPTSDGEAVAKKKGFAGFMQTVHIGLCKFVSWFGFGTKYYRSSKKKKKIFLDFWTYFILSVVALVMLYPLWWMLMASLAYNQNFFTNALKDAYTNKSGSDSLKPSGVYYVDSDGGQGAAADSYITIGRTIRYYPFNFYRFNTYEDALKGNDPVAKLAEMNGGYDVTIMGWPGDTYDTGLEDNPATAYDESIGYVVYSYAEYSAMTYAICYFAQIADRNAEGQHTLMTWLNDDYYGSNNYVYGNDQYEGTLYLTAWLLAAYEKQNNTDVKKSTKFGDDLNVYDSDYAFRDVYLLMTAAEDDAHTFEGTIKGVEGWVECFPESKLSGTVCAGGVGAAGEVKGHKAITQAYEMGRSL